MNLDILVMLPPLSKTFPQVLIITPRQREITHYTKAGKYIPPSLKGEHCV